MHLIEDGGNFLHLIDDDTTPVIPKTFSQQSRPRSVFGKRVCLEQVDQLCIAQMLFDPVGFARFARSP
ncbi:MAG: hypothetical protein ACD_62C00583G0002 [uncultured bacterium]|nr:MAG: hypothetical protein ACD_62C00583G0002 [uncultured bacterium]